MIRGVESVSHLSALSLVLALAGCSSDLDDKNPGGSSGDGDSGLLGDGDGSTGGAGSGSTVAPPDCDAGAEEVGESVLRRLSHIEYQLTVQDLFALPQPPQLSLIPEDVEKEGFASFSDLQGVNATSLRGYLDTAGDLFDEMLAAPERKTQVIGCETSAGTCLKEFTARFGRLAWRETLSEEEIDSLVQAAEENASDTEDQFRFVVEVLLTSARFLFRVEVGDTPDGLSQLSATELASKLSFSLWGRGPSSELLDKAESGALATTDGLVAVAEEMLGDAKAETFFADFFRQWLGYNKLRAPVEPPADWSDDLMPLMTEETDSLIAEYAWQPGEDLFGILTANHSTMTPALARFYGANAEADGSVEFAADDPRYNAGVLGHASLMSQKSDGDKVSKRGNWLRRTFLCEELEVPANLAEIIGDQLVGLTSIEIIEERNTQVACKKCHAAIDPIGIGLAQFDATGRFDENVDLSTYPLEPGFPDAADPNFGSVAELAAKLDSMPETTDCLTERAFIYTQGRHADTLDACTFEDAVSTFSGEGRSFTSLLRSLIVSPAFRLRRPPSTP